MSLTDTAIRNAKPGEKPVRLFDGGRLYYSPLFVIILVLRFIIQQLKKLVVIAAAI